MSTLSHGGIVLLTHAGTDLSTLQRATAQLPDGFAGVIGLHLQAIGDDARMADLLAGPIAGARIVIVRVLGRLQAIPGIDALLHDARAQGRALVIVSGTGEPDPELAARSTVPPALQQEVAAYLQAGGTGNLAQLLRCLSDRLLMTGFGYQPPMALPEHGIYHPELAAPATLDDWATIRNPAWPTVGIAFYRAHWLCGNTRFIDQLVDALAEQRLNALPVYTASLRTLDATGMPAALDVFADDGVGRIDALVNTTSFAMGDVNADGPTAAGWSVAAFARLDVPVVQAIASSMTQAQWAASERGLNPLDTAMNVALPEFDGRIVSVPMSFKDERDETAYAPLPDRVRRVAGIVARQVALRRTAPADKRIAFLFTNSSSKASQIGNAVGLDSPASLLALLRAMQAQGYRIDGLPESGDALIHALIDRGAYDEDYLSAAQLEQAIATVPAARYAAWFSDLPAPLQDKMRQRWGDAPGNAYVHDGKLVFAGMEYGNAFVALQPPRGYGMDPDAIYHTPDLPPTHHYYALYRWLRDEWRADAIVHVGKHGTLEWLPGKGVGVSQTCFPDALLGDLPLFYPFILNDPGEGSQAKRRAHAVIIDHLTPPMTTADTYGPLAQLTQLVDEYYQVEMLDPAKLPLLQQQIWDLIKEARLDADLAAMLKHDHHDHDHEHEHGHKHAEPARVSGGTYRPATPKAAGAKRYRPVSAKAHRHPHGHHHRHHDHDHGHGHGHEHEHEHHHHHDHDHAWDATLNADGVPLSLAKMDGVDVAHLIEDIDGYLCELGAAQIRDGLHVLGRVPADDALVDMVCAMVRLPNLGVPSLPAGVAEALGLAWDALQHDKGKRLKAVSPPLQRLADRPLVTRADALDAVSALTRALIAALAEHGFDATRSDAALASVLPGIAHTGAIRQTLAFVCRELVPNLARTTEEIGNLLHGLAGGYVPAGPSGAPTRGMAHVLPTGRNFYSVDPRSLPSQAAWRIGTALARRSAGAPSHGNRPRSGVGQHQRVGHQRHAHPRRRHRADPGAARRAAALAGGEPPRGRHRGDSAGRAGPAAHRRDGAHQRVLPRCLPAPHPPGRRSGAHGGPAGRARRAQLRAQALPGRSRAPAVRRPAARGRRAPHALSRVRLPARHLRRGHPAPDPGTALAGRRRLRPGLHQLGRLRLRPARQRHRCPRGFPPPAVRRGDRAAQPGQPRARHLRQRRLPAVPRRHDRHHPQPDRPPATPVFRRQPQPGSSGRAQPEGRDAARVPLARGQPEVDRRHPEARLQGRPGADRHRRLPVRLRCHRPCGGRLGL